MKCLIIGASGQVGGQLARRCREAALPWLGTGCRQQSSDLIPLDLTDAAAVRGLIHGYWPAIVFLPAAMTHVDRAELHPAECRAVNVEGTAAVAQAVREVGARLVFFSTDHVFAECDRPMTEDDPIQPQSEYAKSKADAEDRIRSLLPMSHLIVRTSWVFGPEEQEKNFVYRAIRTIRSGEPLVVAVDQFGQPTYGPDLARVAVELGQAGQSGTVHVVGPDRLTRLDHARLIARVFGLDASLIAGRPTAELGLAAPRPRTVWLADDKLRRLLGPDAVRPPEAALRQMRDTMLRDSRIRPDVA